MRKLALEGVVGLPACLHATAKAPPYCGRISKANEKAGVTATSCQNLLTQARIPESSRAGPRASGDLSERRVQLS